MYRGDRDTSERLQRSNTATRKCSSQLFGCLDYLLYTIISSRRPTKCLGAHVLCNIVHPTIAEVNGRTSHQLYKTTGMVVVKMRAQNRPEICVTPAAQEI